MGQKVNPWIIRHTAGYQAPNAVWINTKNPGATLNEDLNVRKFIKRITGMLQLHVYLLSVLLVALRLQSTPHVQVP